MMIKKIAAAVIGLIVIVTILFPIVEDGKQRVHDDNELDVIILAGQSNIAYVPEYMDLDVVNADVPIPSTACYFYGYDSRPVFDNAVLSDCDIHSMAEDGRWIIGGEEASIAYAVSSGLDNDVLVINAGVPGKAISYFEPGDVGGTHIHDVVTDALSKIPETYNVVKSGWVWCQGESNKNTPIADYVASFEAIRDSFIELGFNDCYLVQTKPIDGGNATMAQKMITLTIPDVIMASTAPAGFTADSGTLIVGNTLHYSQKGRDIVGADVGNAIVDNTPIEYEDSPINTLLGIIPLLVLVGFLLGIVALFVRRAEII